MPNPFNSETAPSGPSAPAWDVQEITPNDSTDLTIAARSFYAEVGGDVHVTTAAGNERTFPVGEFQIIPVVVTRIHATGTTATGIVVLFS